MNVNLSIVFFSGSKVLKQPQQAGKYNFTTQFPYYKEVTYKPDFHNKVLGKSVVFDMDMSAGDFLALLYLLKVPVQVIDLKVFLIYCLICLLQSLVFHKI
jgi:hypothetical protein